MNKQVHHWENFGALDEDNTQVGHAIFDRLKRRFCGMRGKTQKKLVFETFLYTGEKFVRDGVKEIMDGTKAKNPAKALTKKNKLGDGNANVPVEKNVIDLDQFDGGDGGVNWDTLVDEVAAQNDQPASLGDFECGVNKNPAIHSFIFEHKPLRSKIVICLTCRARYLEDTPA